MSYYGKNWYDSNKKYHGQLDIDKVLHERYFSNKSNGVLVECGAYDGIVESNGLFFERYLNWTCYNVEPVPILFENLVKNRSKSYNFNFALSSKNGSTIFTQAILPNGEHFGNGSLGHTKNHLSELSSRQCSYEKYEVQTKTYQQFISENKISEIDLFSLDVEGHELDVLEDFEVNPVRPKVFCIEHGQVGKEVLTERMNAINYTLDYQDAINSVYLEIK